MNLSLAAALFKIHLHHIIKYIHAVDLVQNCLCHLQRDLAAICSIHLITVIFRRVMACSHHDTAVTIQVAHCIGQRRCRHQFFIDMNLDSICRKNPGGCSGKYIGFDPAVIGDGHRRLCRNLFQIIAVALGRFCHSMHIHAVGSSADHAAEPTCTKLQLPVKAIVHLFFLPLHTL